MRKKVFCQPALSRLKGIHRLSQSYNRKVRVPHNRRLLDLMDRHAKEIPELYKKKDRHYLTETGDLMVLCCEILLEGRVSADAVMLRCFKRYEKKLTSLMRQESSRRRKAASRKKGLRQKNKPRRKGAASREA